MDREKQIEKSKMLSYYLRHDKSYCFEEGGWRQIVDILGKLNVTFEELTEIVNNDSKQRYKMNDEKDRIRAVDGHDNWITNKKTPAIDYPSVLYHGTNFKSVVSIRNIGLESRNRTYVHMSSDITTAFIAGSRHKKPVPRPVVLCIEPQTVVEKGYNIYYPEAQAWTADYVPQEAVCHKMYIGHTLICYENQEQAENILKVCNSSDIHVHIRKRIESEASSLFHEFKYFNNVDDLINNIIFENSNEMNAIMAFIPIQTKSEITEYENAIEDLIYYINNIQQYLS